MSFKELFKKMGNTEVLCPAYCVKCGESWQQWDEHREFLKYHLGLKSNLDGYCDACDSERTVAYDIHNITQEMKMSHLQLVQNKTVEK